MDTLSQLPLEELLVLWSRELLNEIFGSDPSHNEAPTAAELDAAIATAMAALNDEDFNPWTIEDDEWSREDDLDHRRWSPLSDEQIKSAVHEIVRTSGSDEQIRHRITQELGYPYGDVVLTSHIPTDEVGRSARAIVADLGGLVRQDGAMVMIMMRGAHGNSLLV